MIKATLLLGSLLVLTTAALIKEHDRGIVEGCQSETEVWPSVNGKKYLFCVGDNKALEQDCDPNTFFIKNATVSGCVPVDEIAGNCVYHHDVEPCVGKNRDQPQTHRDPANFWACRPQDPEGSAPIEMSCGEDKAFVKQDGWLGCFPWEEWRKLRGCPVE